MLLKNSNTCWIIFVDKCTWAILFSFGTTFSCSSISSSTTTSFSSWVYPRVSYCGGRWQSLNGICSTPNRCYTASPSSLSSSNLRPFWNYIPCGWCRYCFKWCRGCHYYDTCEISIHHLRIRLNKSIPIRISRYQLKSTNSKKGRNNKRNNFPKAYSLPKKCTDDFVPFHKTLLELFLYINIYKRSALIPSLSWSKWS